MKVDVQRSVVRVDGAVGQDDRDAGFLRFLQHRVPARFDDRRERDDVDLLLDEGADGLDLVLLLLLRVGEFQLDAGLGRGFLDRFGVGRAPAALGADLGEAEHDFLACCGVPAHLGCLESP